MYNWIIKYNCVVTECLPVTFLWLIITFYFIFLALLWCTANYFWFKAFTSSFNILHESCTYCTCTWITATEVTQTTHTGNITFSIESRASEIWLDVRLCSLFWRHCNTLVNVVNHVSMMSTSAQRLADIVSLQDLVFYIAPHDGHVIILAVMLYRIFLLHVYFNLALRSSRKYLYPPWKGFLLWPPNLWIFQNWLIKWTPPHTP